MLSPFHLDAPARPRIAAAELVQGIVGLARGERLVVLGIARDKIGAIVSGGPDQGCDRGRSALLVSCEGKAAAEAIVDRLLDDLAALALARWPGWHVQDDGGASVPADEPAAGPPRLYPWLKAASKRAGLGLPPRFRRLGPERELAHLSRAIDPDGVVLIWDVDPASAARARPVIEALEWCARHGAAVVVGLASAPPETVPYDRLLYGARTFDRREQAAVERFIAPTGAHHASAVERRVAEALGRDTDLQGLFVCNAPVLVGAWGGTARVDLLCSAHRIVVELDGPEHRTEPKFSDDRHRDYELLMAGYLVLRLTNEQVAADLLMAVDKIRAVVRLRLGANGGTSE